MSLICAAAFVSACAPGQENLEEVKTVLQETGGTPSDSEMAIVNLETGNSREIIQSSAGAGNPVSEAPSIESEITVTSNINVDSVAPTFVVNGNPTVESPNNEPETSAATESPSNEPEIGAATESPNNEPEISAATESPSNEPEIGAATESPNNEPEISAAIESELTETSIDSNVPSTQNTTDSSVEPAEIESEQNEGDADTAETESHTIDSIRVSAVSTDSATVEWDLSDNGTGQILFGTSSSNLDMSTVPENRLIFRSHRQVISNLNSGTQYFFQVQSGSSAGQIAISEVLTFTTSQESNEETVTPEVQVESMELPSDSLPSTNPLWPSTANNNIPYSGLFYGQYESGFHTGNSRIALQSSRRFRSDRSGFIDAVSYNNRTLGDENISGRCTASNPNSVWCNCHNAGLDKYTCGYTLSNSYSVGNGGSIVVQIRANDAANGNIPDSVILGETSIPFVPMENENVYTPILELKSPVYLNAGDIYHLVFVNLNAPSNCGLSGQSVSVASSCPRNQGAMGLNGVTLVKTKGFDGGLDPFRGKSGATLTKSSLNSAWIEDPDTLSWYEIRYSDGIWRGDSYAAYASTSAGRQTIGGNKIARQVFTVNDATRIVDGLWLNYGFDTGTVPTSSEISIVLKDSADTVMATGTINTTDECIAHTLSGNASGNWSDQHCKQWSYTEFNQVAPLIEGNTYSVEISAPSGSDLVLATVFELNYGPYTFNSSNRWNDAHAEISTNNGSTWTNWEGANRRLRDLTMMFTISGMPRQLP